MNLRIWRVGLAGVLPVALALATAAVGQQVDELPAPVAQAVQRVSAGAIRAHVRYLADDLLEGRDTGTNGNHLAARYIAAQFEQHGLTAPVDGSYFQQVPFVRSGQDLEKTRIVVSHEGKDQVLKFGDDFLFSGTTRAEAMVEAPLVFAGFGITAPEFQHDDYKDLDVKGKVVVAYMGEPASKDAAVFAGDAPTKYSNLATKLMQAREKGAAGLIGILPSHLESGFGWERVRRFSGGRRLGLGGQAAPPPAGFPALVVRPAAAARLLAGSPRPAAELDAATLKEGLKPFPLPSHTHVELVVTRETFQAPNVAGLLQGSDPVLKKQVVVVTAHYDHVGRQTVPEGQDGIFNGAWDNASGTAGVLELARSMAALPVEARPKRSVLFLLVTGEEHGLLGSAHYTQKPIIPIADTAANINLDMTEIFGVPKDFCPLGAEFSTLKGVAEKVARQLKMKIGPDPTPELRTFGRSDQFSFVQAGVPAIFLRWGNEYEDIPADQVKAAHKTRLDTIYHKVADGFDPTWSWEGMRRHTQIALLLGYHIANDDALPGWVPGSPYNKPRAGAAAP